MSVPDNMEDAPRPVPIETTSIRIGGVTPEMRHQLEKIKVKMGWTQWLDMTHWINDNLSELPTSNYPDPVHPVSSGYIVMRKVPIEIRMSLYLYMKRNHLPRLSSFVNIVLHMLGDNDD